MYNAKDGSFKRLSDIDNGADPAQPGPRPVADAKGKASMAPVLADEGGKGKAAVAEAASKGKAALLHVNGKGKKAAAAIEPPPDGPVAGTR